MAALALMLAVACGGRTDRTEIRVADLIKQFDYVEKRPAAGAFEIAEYTLAGRTLPSVVTPASTRLVWTYAPLPRRAVLRTDVGIPRDQRPSRVHVRVGISDRRVYETLRERIIDTAESGGDWIPLEADLSRYAGPQWSLFYRPDERRWEIVLASVVLEGSPQAVYWGRPAIHTDVAAARRHFAQRTSAPPS
jgi:hypothetical protein